jgi:hypothetical protein
MLLTEMISDEDDEEAISKMAYECLEFMGTTSISVLIKCLQNVLSQRDYQWNEKNSIIIDIHQGVERHLCTLRDLKQIPNMRDFGIQD